MGYLNDTWRALDAVMADLGVPEGSREFVHKGYFLGVKAMLEGIEQRSHMEHDEGEQFMGGIASEWQAFSDNCAAVVSARVAAALVAAAAGSA